MQNTVDTPKPEKEPKRKSRRKRKHKAKAKMSAKNISRVKKKSRVNKKRRKKKRKGKILKPVGERNGVQIVRMCDDVDGGVSDDYASDVTDVSANPNPNSPQASPVPVRGAARPSPPAPLSPVLKGITPIWMYMDSTSPDLLERYPDLLALYSGGAQEEPTKTPDAGSKSKRDTPPTQVFSSSTVSKHSASASATSVDEVRDVAVIDLVVPSPVPRSEDELTEASADELLASAAPSQASAGGELTSPRTPLTKRPRRAHRSVSVVRQLSHELLDTRVKQAELQVHPSSVKEICCMPVSLSPMHACLSVSLSYIYI